MALMTPRGLKIRLELPWAFGLLARLWTTDRRTDAFRVLKTCEAIERVPETLAFVAALATVCHAGLPTWFIGVAYVVGTFVGVVLTQIGLFVVIRTSGFLLLSLIWSWISGYGILLVAGLAFSWWARGWHGPTWWLAGIVAAFLVRQVVEFVFVKRIHRLVGQPLTSAEINFFNAYRLHADRLGLPRDLQVSDAEIETDAWRECLLDYAEKYPESVARFPDQGSVLRAIWSETAESTRRGDDPDDSWRGES